MPKWLKIKDKTSQPYWYYFNPDDGNVTYDKKIVLKYDFNSNGVCTTPNGY